MSEPSSPQPQTTTGPTVAPVLSTHEDPSFFTLPPPPPPTYAPKTHAELRSFFEIDRTIAELRSGGWSRIALQFPDELLQLGATQVYELLRDNLNAPEAAGPSEGEDPEIAAEHVSADVLVHYGRACLSPTARLPVIYVFTHPPLSQQSVLDTFTTLFPDRTEKVVVMADVTYTSHLHPIVKKLREESGYTQIWEAEVIHDPSALLPNRTLPLECVPGESDSAEKKAEMARILREEWTLFHISTPMTSLLLVLASRVGKVHIFPTDRDATVSAISTAPLATMPLLRRRYALLTQLRAASIIGILVSTLSVKNYLPLISLLQRLIRSKGKKSYMVVVGKVNPEKLANFSEGENGEAGKGRFWEWNGEWITDFDTLLKRDPTGGETAHESTQKQKNSEKGGNYDSTPGSTSPADDEDPSNPLSHLPESLPPDFDLRTGRYSSTSRPLAHLPTAPTTTTTTNPASSALTEKNKHSHLLAPTGGVLSPAAEFLKEKRTWRGLVVGYEDEDWSGASGGGGEGAQMEVGRSGVARGYNVGWEGERR
ncbi:diphthamide biosynthesis protein [Terfezia boudieri ATCC MYA-4762]|uniref:S-adenosyl-L-methionine:L-histidine 3-amino-3-carboxypropyltransferase 2 n=1 Tax=Terfezia boudieri ATCC MYA-4762 TaxID=1051890 RepID=A0A3N4M0L8_9PEZI|nr:diphthamide biosynthesis protein [Terfezia boudieri ATCC MYA-4762]